MARILIVDDERDYLDAIVERLVNRSFEVVGAASGEEALSALPGGDFDVVLLDIKMHGGMDGIDTLREIKQVQSQAEVILITAHASVENCIAGMRLGAFDYLLKPVDFEELLQKIAQALERK